MRTKKQQKCIIDKRKHIKKGERKKKQNKLEFVALPGASEQYCLWVRWIRLGTFVVKFLDLRFTAIVDELWN